MITLNSATTSKVSDILILESRARGDIFTNLKLQKILYYAQAWFLALNDAELFTEDFQAWVHGPVLPSQYQRFKHNEWRPIQDAIYGPTRTGNVVVDKHLINILDIFGTESAGSLEIMTHSERPWIDARRGLSATSSSNAVISKKSMKDYYRSL